MLESTFNRLEDKRAPVDHMIMPGEYTRLALPSQQQASQLSLKSTSLTQLPHDSHIYFTADYLHQAEVARLSQEGWEGAAGRAGDRH